MRTRRGRGAKGGEAEGASALGQEQYIPTTEELMDMRKSVVLPAAVCVTVVRSSVAVAAAAKRNAHIISRGTR